MPIPTDGGSQPGVPFDAPGTDAGGGGAMAQHQAARQVIPSPSQTMSGGHIHETPAAKRVKYGHAAAPVLLAPPVADGEAPMVPFHVPETLTAELKAMAEAQGGVPGEAALVLHVANQRAAQSGRSGSCEVRVTRGAEVLWKDSVSSTAISVAGNARVAAIACQDGSLHCYTAAGGRRLTCPLMLGAPVTMLRFARKGNELTLLTLTSAGRLRVIDLKAMRTTADVEVSSLLGEEGVGVIDASLSRTGVPTITLSSRRVYALHAGVGCWQRVVDAQAFEHSSFASVLAPAADAEGADAREVGALEAGARGGKSPQLRRALLGTSAKKHQEETTRHLETLMAAALSMDSPAEYKDWLRAYASNLAAAAEGDRLKEFCQELLGPPHVGNEGDSEWSPWVLGMHSRHLVRFVVLPAMAKSHEMQRLVLEIKDEVDELYKRHGTPPAGRDPGAGVTARPVGS